MLTIQLSYGRPTGMQQSGGYHRLEKRANARDQACCKHTHIRCTWNRCTQVPPPNMQQSSSDSKCCLRMFRSPQAHYCRGRHLTHAPGQLRGCRRSSHLCAAHMIHGISQLQRGRKGGEFSASHIHQCSFEVTAGQKEKRATPARIRPARRSGSGKRSNNKTGSKKDYGGMQ